MALALNNLQRLICNKAQTTNPPLFTLFYFYSVVCQDGKVYDVVGFVPFFYADYHYVWKSCRDYIVCLYLKIPERCMCLIFLIRFSIVNIPLVHSVRFKFIAFLNSSA